MGPWLSVTAGTIAVWRASGFVLALIAVGLLAARQRHCALAAILCTAAAVVLLYLTD